MTYDSSRGRIVLFGGYNGTRLSDTWELPSNRPPALTAASSAAALTGRAVSLTATFSDPDADTPTFRWLQTFGPAVSIQNSSSATASFSTTVPGDYGFQVVASDSREGFAYALGTVTVAAAPLISANAGADFIADLGANVVLAGSGSGSGTLSFAWTQTAGPAVTLQSAATATPGFTPSARGTYTFRLTVTDSNSDSAQDDVTVTINAPPLARVNASSTVNRNQLVSLDGSTSSDPEDGALTYSWSVVSGPASRILSDTNQPIARFTPRDPGQYTLRLSVSDSRLTSTADLTITASNRAPVSSPRAPSTTALGSIVLLDGSNSSDADSDPLEYAWLQTAGPQTVALAAPASARTTFLPGLAGTYTFNLQATDSFGARTTAPVSVTVVDQTPPTVALSYVPSANLTQAGVLTIRFDFNESMRSAGPTPAVTFARSAGSGQLRGGNLTAISNTVFTFTTSVTAANNGIFTLSLVAADLAGNAVTQPGANNTLAISVPNSRPVADAGADQTFDVSTLVTLNGSNSFDADGDPLTYAWTIAAQPQGSSVSLSDPTTARPTFTPQLAGQYRFTLQVTDPLSASATDTVTITVQSGSGGNRNPVADGGADRDVIIGGIVRLNASASSDPDGDSLSYLWNVVEVPSGSIITNSSLTGLTSSTVSFEPDLAGRYRFSVTVGDGRGGSDSDIVLVGVRPTPVDDYQDSFDQATISVQPGAEALGTLGSPTDTDFLLFPVSTGNIYTFSLSSTDLSSYQLALFSPNQSILMLGDGTPASPVVLRDYRPISGTRHFLRVSSSDRSTGRWRLMVAVRPETEVLPPAFSVEAFLASGQPVAAVRTAGTSVPLSAMQLVIAYDGSTLKFRNTAIGPAASLAFNESPRQFEFPFIDLTFQSKEAAAATLAPGLVDTLNFQARESGNLRLEPDSVTILQASVTRPQRQVTVLRPTADAGLSQSLDSSPIPGGGPGFPDPLAPGATRRPWLRLDGRFSIDANEPPLPLRYRWSVLATPSATLALSDAASPIPTFAFAGPGLYRFGLNVSNGVLTSPTQTVSLFVERARAAPSADIAASTTAVLFGAPEARGEEALVVPAGAVVRLDGRGSTDPSPARRSTLVYTWRQTEGPTAAALPSSATIDVRLQEAGTYAFELVVTNNLGLESRPERVSLLAFVPGLRAPGLAIQASSPAVPERGSDLGADPDSSAAPALRVPAASPVLLAATVSRATSELEARLGFFWQQTSGAAVRFSQSTADVTTASVSRIDFTPVEAGVYTFACTARVIDPLGNVTGLRTRRFIRIVADGRDRRVPEALIRIAAATPGASKTATAPSAASGDTAVFANAGQVVRLDGSGSTGASGFAWRQVEGPPVVLSNSSSAVTTFAVPDLGDASVRRYAFQLFTDDGVLRGAPARAQLAVVPRAAVGSELVLAPGLNLVSLPIAALGTTGTLTLDELARRAGASLVIASGREGLDRGRFVPAAGLGGLRSQSVRGNHGFLLKVEGQQERLLQLLGSQWPTASLDLELNAGLNLVGYPARAVPDSVRTAAGLLRFAKNASFVVRLVRGKFEVYLPGLSPEFPIEPGKAYILSNRVAETVSLP